MIFVSTRAFLFRSVALGVLLASTSCRAQNTERSQNADLGGGTSQDFLLDGPLRVYVYQFDAEHGPPHDASGTAQLIESIGTDPNRPVPFGIYLGIQNTGVEGPTAGFDELAATLNPDDFDVLVFANICPWAVTDSAKATIQDFVEAGKGFVGIHCAAYATGHVPFPWYQANLLGGLTPTDYPTATASAMRVDASHPSTSFLEWPGDLSDPIRHEFYDYDALEAGRLHFLLTVENVTDYESPLGGQAPPWTRPHPLSFCRQGIGGGSGRSWLTQFGHDLSTLLDNQWIQDHIYEGIRWAGGNTVGDCQDDNPAIALP
jgi:type 1 glutamine amidotransferase